VEPPTAEYVNIKAAQKISNSQSAQVTAVPTLPRTILCNDASLSQLLDQSSSFIYIDSSSLAAQRELARLLKLTIHV
jgi:hypothetical protein